MSELVRFKVGIQRIGKDWWLGSQTKSFFEQTCPVLLFKCFFKSCHSSCTTNTHSAGFSTFPPLKCPLQIVILGHTAEMSHTDPGAVIPHLCRTEARTNPDTTRGTGLRHGPCRRLAWEERSVKFRADDSCAARARLPRQKRQIQSQTEAQFSRELNPSHVKDNTHTKSSTY